MRARIVRSPRLWRSASAPLIVSVWFACAFVALRLAYRLIFGGWPETLDSWGSTVGGVIRTSLPFVAVVVFFGALNTVVDVSSALTRWGGRGPLRNMRTALVIALASYPSLLSSIRRVNASRRMRGDRSVASLIMPVLERSLERGVALGAAMEQRGFGSTGTTYGMCDAPVVARNFSIGFGSHAQPTWTLDVGDLTIAHGSCVLLTDSSAQEDQLSFLKTIAEGYAPGDSDFAWTRLTPWRQQLASVLDQPPFESITSAEVQAADASLSARLLAAWLSLSLDIRVAYTAVSERSDVGSIQRVTLSRASGDIVLERTEPGQARLTQPGQPVHDITLVRRNLRDCLAEELRHLDPDEVYGTVIRDGLSRVDEIS